MPNVSTRRNVSKLSHSIWSCFAQITTSNEPPMNVINATISDPSITVICLSIFVCAAAFVRVGYLFWKSEVISRDIVINS